jgi:serine/threonine-protein kinase
VLQADRNVRVNVSLIDPATDEQLWADAYSRELSVANIVEIQGDVARHVAAALDATLSPTEQARLAVAPTENLEAYQLYLQGRFFWGQRGEGIQRGLEFFERAVAIDSQYALAHAGRADAYSLLGYYGGLRSAEARLLARAAARRAFALDSSLAEASTALAWVSLTYDRDMSAAERQFRRAIELNPNYVPAHYWYALYLYYVARRDDEAVAEARWAVELDPLSSHAAYQLGEMLRHVGEYTESMMHVRRAIALAPNSFTNYWQLAELYQAESRYPEALAALDTAIVIGGRIPMLLTTYGEVLVASGDTAGAIAIHAELVARGHDEYTSPARIGFLSGDLGRMDEMWEWLERALQEWDPALVFGYRIMESDNKLGVLNDPRWDDFWRRASLR